MLYRLAAEGILLLHLAFIVFAVGGGWLALRWRPVLWLQLPACAWAVWIMASGRICPLTPLENRLRQLAGEQGYTGGFIEHYVLALIYPEGITREVQIALAMVVLGLNLLVWVILLRRSHRA
ncbi:MAG: DUF2784 domain-containing protein [Burkholderiales bacterium]|nr:DUF2784 domain-containing protein [Burkholderiales bacterium]